MHAVSDFMLEAAMNSSEAGSSRISIKAVLSEEYWNVTVADDGIWTLEEGSVTTKGERRGRALALLSESAESWHIEKGEGTVLSFRMADDGSMDDLYHALLPVFLREEEVEVIIGYGDGGAAFSTSGLKKMNAYPEGASGIRSFRALMERHRRR